MGKCLLKVPIVKLIKLLEVASNEEAGVRQFGEMLLLYDIFACCSFLLLGELAIALLTSLTTKLVFIS